MLPQRHCRHGRSPSGRRAGWRSRYRIASAVPERVAAVLYRGGGTSSPSACPGTATATASATAINNVFIFSRPSSELHPQRCPENISTKTTSASRQSHAACFSVMVSSPARSMAASDYCRVQRAVLVNLLRINGADRRRATVGVRIGRDVLKLAHDLLVRVLGVVAAPGLHPATSIAAAGDSDAGILVGSVVCPAVKLLVRPWRISIPAADAELPGERR